MVIQRKFIIIGTDDNRTPFFPPEVLEHIRHGKVFSGGVRHKEIVGNLLPDDAEWISITVPLDNVFSQYEKVFSSNGYGQTDAVPRQIIVFASGDPLFFGFANTVKRKLPDAEIKLYPSFNSLQTLAHRLVMPYDDMRTVSLTGRPWNEFDRALIERAPKIGILTDREHTPATIAARMLEYGYDRYTMYVGEHLGNPEKERIRHMTLQEARRIRASQQPVALRHLFSRSPPFWYPRRTIRTFGRTYPYDNQSTYPPAYVTSAGTEPPPCILGYRFLHRVGFH